MVWIWKGGRDEEEELYFEIFWQVKFVGYMIDRKLEVKEREELSF